MSGLFDIAYKRERVLARRLATRTGISLDEALEKTLAAAAGAQSIDSLIAAREQGRLAEQERRATRQRQKEATRVRKAQSGRPDPTAWLAWFDGATHPNPGRMGIGGVLKSPAGDTTEISVHAGWGDSSEAEYLALIAVLQAALDSEYGMWPARLVIYGDSQVVINDVDLQATKVSKALTEKREHARGLMAQLPHVTLCWIPRKKNAEADALSQRAIGTMRTLRLCGEE